jgi:glycerol-3-phosphate acyltransferase PlsX
MTSSLSAKIGYLFARGAFAQLRERMDPRRANGGVFLGLNGIVIKSHGGSDAEGYAAAIEVGHGVVRDELLAKISAALARHGKSEAGKSEAGKSEARKSQPDKSQIGSSQVLESKNLENKAVGGAAS